MFPAARAAEGGVGAGHLAAHFFDARSAGRDAGQTQLHLETLVIYKLGAMEFITQNNLSMKVTTQNDLCK